MRTFLDVGTNPNQEPLMKTVSLPPPVAAYVAASNAFDLEGLMATFADDALVNDHRCDFPGRESIRAWAAREIIADRVTMDVVAAKQRGQSISVTAHVDGTFDKKGLPSPLVLTFYFSFNAAKIEQLIIIMNSANQAQS
jgi:SnoaL-like domain